VRRVGNKPLSYQNAAKLLGAQSTVLAAVNKLAGTGLTIASAGIADAALSLFDLKSEVERLGQDLDNSPGSSPSSRSGRTPSVCRRSWISSTPCDKTLPSWG
jgi:NACHT N-terminal Helical domain 7